MTFGLVNHPTKKDKQHKAHICEECKVHSRQLKNIRHKKSCSQHP